jgi:hypothetical protein
MLPTLWARGVQKLRIAPLGELTDTLPVTEAKVIDEKLREADLLDVGSLKKVFLDPAPTGHEQQQQQLRQILTDHERALLTQALHDYLNTTPDPPGGPAGPAGPAAPSGPGGPGSPADPGGASAGRVRGVLGRLWGLRSRLVGAGSAHGPPAAGSAAAGVRGSAWLRAQIGARRAAIAGIRADRWVDEQLPLRRLLMRHLVNIAGRMAALESSAASGSVEYERLRVLAGQLLVELDRHIAVARRAGWNARWRGGVSRSHRWVYVPVTTVAIGLQLHAMYSMAVLAGAPSVVAVIAAGVLFTVSAFGQVLGMGLVGPLWHRFPVRVVTVATLLAGAAAFVGFAVIGGWAPGYYAAAVLAGVAASGNFNLLDVLQGWIDRTTAARRAAGQRAVLGDGVAGLAVLGLVATLSVMLGITETLVEHSLVWAAGVPAVIMLLVAVASWLVAPSERWDRPAPLSLKQMFVAPIRTVKRNPFARAVVAVYATYAFTSAAMDAMWRPFFAASGAAGWLVTASGFAFVGGGLLLAALFVGADRKAARGGTGDGLLNTRPGAFVVSMAGLMALGVLIIGFTAHVFGDPLIGTMVGLYMLETTSTGKLLGLSAVIGQTARLTAQEKTDTKIAGGLFKAIFYVLGGLVSSQVAWTHGGWDSVSVLGVVAGLAVFTAAAKVDPHALLGMVKAVGRAVGRVWGGVAGLGGRAGTRGGYAAAGVVAGAAGAAVALAVHSGTVGTLIAVAAAVAGPVLLMLLHHVWTHGPPWARWTVKALVVVAVTVTILTLTASAAHADTGTPATVDGHSSGLSAWLGSALPVAGVALYALYALYYQVAGRRLDRGDDRFHVWGYGDTTFVSRAHGAEAWARGALGDEPAGRAEGAPTRQDVADLLDRAGWPEAIRDGHLAEDKLDQLADPVVHREILETLQAQDAGRIRGMDDWLKFNGEKGIAELREAALELGDARQLEIDNPGMVVRVGRENNAPWRKEPDERMQDPGERMQEFDLSVETQTGEVMRVIEVTAMDRPIIRAPQVTKKVRHAADKVVSRREDGAPVEGSAEALVHVRLPEGPTGTERKGGSLEILEGGTMIRRRPDGTLILPKNELEPGNLFKDIETQLAASDINSNLDRVTLVTQYGRIVYVRQGKTWTWEQGTP